MEVDKQRKEKEMRQKKNYESNLTGKEEEPERKQGNKEETREKIMARRVKEKWSEIKGEGKEETEKR